MELSGGKARTAALCLLSTFVGASIATPSVAFPFNSQVPTVARINEPYLFQISSSTFAPEATNFTYSLADQPAWLSIDSASRALSGTPDENSVGASTFTLTAADDTGAAHMSCTLVVSSEPGPQLRGDISQQLAATANLSSSDPPVVTLLPSTAFDFEFQQSSFIDIVQRKLYYYATLTDHTPLPAWLAFDAAALRFSGVAPLLSAFPQSWSINLIASDVAGFASATASFTLAIGMQQLAFVPSEQTVNVTAGEHFAFTGLQNQLFRNGAQIPSTSLAKAQASSLPSWLSFDASTLAMAGTVPTDIGNETVFVTVTDELGDTATALINLVNGNASLFASTVGILTAYVGQAFTYHFPPSMFNAPDLQLMVTLPATATWLSFNPTSQELHGTVPSQTTPSAIAATLTAKSSSLPAPQAQSFTIDVKAAVGSAASSSHLSTRASPTSSSIPTPSPALVGTRSRSHLSAGIIAAIVVLSVLAAVTLIALLIICLRRRRQDGYERHSATPVKKRIISRPIPPLDPDAITVTTVMQTDVEKMAGGAAQEYSAREDDPPPQIALDLPSRATSKRSRWLNRFSHISQASSLGVGEDAIRQDSNIPEWGAETAALHTPHDSFSVPTEMARVSRQLSQSSPTKRAMKRLRERHRSRQSIGLGIDTAGPELGAALPRHSSKNSRHHRRGTSSLGLSAAMDRSSQASLSTRGTSVLSTRPSDFPRPPTRSTFTMSQSVPTLSITEADRHKSIRLVGRSDSIPDNRSVADKRQSFIRNRASTSLQSPLFSHGSRASSRNENNESAAASTVGSKRRARRGRSKLTSYSESSSLEPQRESRRLSARVRSAFAPNFPRAITQSSLGADDEGADVDRESSSDLYTTTSSAISEEDWKSQLALPKHQRNFVLPGEASPTPPPAPPTSRQPSSRRSTPSATEDDPRQKWRRRMKERSASPLSTAVAIPVVERSSLSAAGRASIARRSRLSEPVSLVSTDSVNRAKMERPRLIHAKAKRPVSVEEVKRLSSLRAETGPETDTQGGSEVWEDIEHGTELEGSGLMPKSVAESKANTQTSTASGPAFL